MPPHSENISPVVLLTGAGSGIGLIVAAKLLAHHDARIQVLTLMETPELSALEKEYQGRISSVYGDATDVSLPVIYTVERGGNNEQCVLKRCLFHRTA